jgi:gamma-glutamyltranspeptidase/glutathione hydrolase
MPCFGQGRNYGRSMVIARQGIAATSQVQASQSAAQILARGGSAVDAAIAANAVLAVFEPMKCGPGGDLFVLHREAATGELTGLNASGPAPEALSPEHLAAHGFDSMPQEGIHSVTVPGAVEGWGKIHARFGKLPWKALFEDAIAFACEGFPVPEIVAETWADGELFAKIHSNPESVRIFLQGGKPPHEGDLFRNPDMARAFELIAAQGPATFYTGEVATAILKTSQSLGGTMTPADLARFSSEWVEPISTDYRGWRIFELPPNSQGVAALEMLNIMEASPAAIGGFDSAEEMHKRIEAMKLAYADVRRHNARQGETHRSRPRQRRRPGRATDRERHHISDRSRQAGKHGQLDSKHLRGICLGGNRRGHGFSAAEPGRRIHSRSAASQRARGR